MRNLVAVTVTDTPTGPMIRGWVARQKNRRVCWQYNGTGMTANDCAIRSMELELDRAEADGFPATIERIKGVLDDRRRR